MSTSVLPSSVGTEPAAPRPVTTRLTEPEQQHRDATQRMQALDDQHAGRPGWDRFVARIDQITKGNA
jgi:hypothetical protein